MLRPPFQDALVLTGPTGSGKTALGIELALRLGAEIIAMDSMTLYRRMDIGTAKPTAEERRRVPHHLIDVLEPWESATVAWWLDQAVVACKEIKDRGRRVLFVGGTPLYLKALLFGLFEGPGADVPLRRQLAREAQESGSAALHARLAAVDPVTAARLQPNDVRRVVRALEVWETTRQPISEWQQQWKGRVAASHREPSQPTCLCLHIPRRELYDRIDRRVLRMVKDGLVEEVRALRGLPHPVSVEAT